MTNVDYEELDELANQALEGVDDRERRRLALEVERDLNKCSTESGLVRERQKTAFQIIHDRHNLSEIEINALDARLRELSASSAERQLERAAAYKKYHYRVSQVTVQRVLGR